MDNKTGKWVVYVFILLLPFGVFYWQVPFLGDRVTGNDYGAFPIQHQMELQYSLKHGTFPLYVPGFAGGQSAAALTLGELYHPLSHLASALPGYWEGHALQWNTFLRLFSLGLVHLGLFILLVRLRLNPVLSFVFSFITVYNMRMLDLFRYGASLENYTGYLFLCLAMAFYYMKPTRFLGPVSIIAATYLLVCGGHPQMMYLGLLGAGIAAVAIPFILGKISGETGIDRQRLFKYFKTTVICILAGILLSSVYTLPFYFDFVLTNAQRAGQDYQWALQYSSSSGGMLNNFFAPLQCEVQAAFGSSPIIILIALVPLLYVFRIKVPIAVITLWAILVLIFLCGLGKETSLHYYFWKYFPFAGNFRVPGRITMLFPFLFLLILAWLFRRTNEKVKFGSKKLPFSPFLFPGLIAAALFLLYNWVWIKYLPKPRAYMPKHIAPYPHLVDSLILWLGFFTLILVVLYSFHLKGFFKKWTSIVGVLLAAAVLVQVTVEFRYGTWIIKKRPQATLSRMDKQKKRALYFRGDPGFGMESLAVSTQKKNSILEPALAKFYRKYKRVSNQNQAYRFLWKENVIDTLVVESAPGMAASFKNMPDDSKNDDKILLEENTFNRVLFSVTAGSPGFFTLSFPYSNGWNATVNGNNARIFRANGYMQAVYLEAGQQKIEFRYWSKAAFAGIMVSCLTFLLIGSYFAFFVFRGKQRIFTATIGLLVPLGIFLAWYTSLYSGGNLGTRYTWSSKDFPSPKNLAYAKRSAMNFGRSFYYAGFGVDGKIGKPFKTDQTKKGWWHVNLGSPKEIGEIVIYDGPRMGQEHLPLHILGSIDGKEFKLLKSVTVRGPDKPWRIPMNGEITRFVQLNSSKKTSLSFSEVQIFPPTPLTGAKKENPLIALVHSEPVTKAVLDNITLLNDAVRKGDINKIKVVLEKDKNAGVEIKKIQMFEALNEAVEMGNAAVVRILVENGAEVNATDSNGSTPLMKAVENGYLSIVAILRGAGAKLPSCLREMGSQKVVDIFMDKKIKSFDDREIKVWNGDETGLQTISPSLLRFSIIGIYKFEVSTDKGRNIIVVRKTKSKKNEKSRIQLGYEFNRKSLNKKIPRGKYVHFIVSAAISPNLMDKNNYLFISDYKKGWESKKTYFSSSSWQTYLVSKKVRPVCSRLVMAFRFSPQSREDRLKIRDVKILVSEKPL